MANKHGGRRPGAGRPPEMDRGTDVTMRLAWKDIEAVRAIAQRESMAMSAVIRQAVQRFLEDQKG